MSIIEFRVRISGYSDEALCRLYIEADKEALDRRTTGITKEQIEDLVQDALGRRGESLDRCIATASWSDTRNYSIDNLNIRTFSMRRHDCESGGVHEIHLSGAIGPDSTYAMREILSRLPNCQDKSDRDIRSTRVVLASNGGLLEHGYALGKLFREFGVATHVGNFQVCASSCAVAFLGGVNRSLQRSGSLMFHAPYRIMTNDSSYSVMTCKLEVRELEELRNFFVSMTGADAGSRLFERTMSYCDVEEGWEIRGPDAARLYGLTTN